MRYGSSCPPLPTCLCSVVPACSTIVPHVALRCVATRLVSFWFEMVGEIFARREGCFFNNTLPPPKSSTVYYIPLCNGASVSTVQSSTGHVQWHAIYRVDSVLVVGGIVYQRIDKYQLFLALHPFFFFGVFHAYNIIRTLTHSSYSPSLPYTYARYCALGWHTHVHMQTNTCGILYCSTVFVLDMTNVKILKVLISIETVKVLRERMSNCYKYEGVNHLENCKEYVEAYSNAIWEIKRKNTPAIGQ